jgi:hypothetical protein
MALVIKDANGVVINIGAWDDLEGTNPLPEGAVEADISNGEVAEIIARADAKPTQRTDARAKIQTLISQGKTEEALTQMIELI